MSKWNLDVLLVMVFALHQESSGVVHGACERNREPLESYSSKKLVESGIFRMAG